jgi:hypothetical protein
MDIHKDCFSAIDLPDKTVPAGGRRSLSTFAKSSYLGNLVRV